MQIYLARNNEQAGPYTLEQVNAMLANTQIVLTDLAWHEGMETWLPLGQLTGGKMVYNPSNSASATIAPFKTSASITIASETLANGATLANVGKRIGAAAIDFFLLLSVMEIGFSSTMNLESLNKMNESSKAVLNIITTNSKIDVIEILKPIFSSIPNSTYVTLAVLMLLLTLLQTSLIASRGQTIGKILLKIRIVDEVTFLKTSFKSSVLFRSILAKYIGYNLGYFYLFITLSIIYGLNMSQQVSYDSYFYQLLNAISSLLLIADFIFLFTKNNRTLHDRLAKTIVVNAEPIQLEKPKS